MSVLRPAQKKILLSALIVLVTVGVYWPVGDHEFLTYDDSEYVTQNEVIRAGLTWRTVGWAFSGSHVSNWHPLTWLSHALDCEWFGLAPRAHHFSNLFFHALNSVLLFLVLGRMTGRLVESAMVAALFALHPLHVESVAWVAERKDLLSAFFWCLSLWAYVRYTARPGVGRYLLLVLTFGLGLMAKPMVVTLPFVLLLLDVWPLGRWALAGNARSSLWAGQRCPPRRLAGLLLEKLPLLLLSAASSVITYLAQLRGGAIDYSEYHPMSSRIANALVAYVRYLAKTVWPADLAAHYPLPAAWAVGSVVGAAFLLLAITIAVAWLLRSKPYLLVGWLWFLGTLVPVIGLVKIGSQSMADRYTYLPLIGIFLAIVWLVADAIGRSAGRGRAAACAGVLALMACAFGVRQQLPHWQDDIRLYTRMVSVNPDNPVGHYNLGAAYKAQGKIDQAVAHFREVLRINPELYFRETRVRAGDADTHYSLGVMLLALGRHEQALTNFVSAAALSPSNALARLMWGKTLLAQSKPDEAIAPLSEALQMAPDQAEARLLLATALDLQHREQEAIPLYREVLRHRPDQLEALKNLAWILATHPESELRQGPEAVALGMKLCELAGSTNAVALGTLAAAYAEVGQFDEAIRTAQTACDAASQAGQTGILAMLQQQLQSYRAGRPLRQ